MRHRSRACRRSWNVDNHRTWLVVSHAFAWPVWLVAFAAFSGNYLGHILFSWRFFLDEVLLGIVGVEVLAVDHKGFELIDDLRLLVVQEIEDIAALVVGHMGCKLEADHNAKQEADRNSKQEADHSHIAAVGTAAMMEELLGHLVHHQYNVAVVLVQQ